VGVTELVRHASGETRFTVCGTDGRAEPADIVIATVPSPVLLKLVPDMPEPYCSQLTAAVYQGAVCVLLQLSQPLSSTYWLNIGDPRLPFTGIIEHTNFIGPEHY